MNRFFIIFYSPFALLNKKVQTYPNKMEILFISSTIKKFSFQILITWQDLIK